MAQRHHGTQHNNESRSAELGVAARHPAPVHNSMDTAMGDKEAAMVHVFGAAFGDDNTTEDLGFWDSKGHGWSTGLFEFMSPDATSVFDWGYVCTSCACPCLQFYYNWLRILDGAPEQRFYCMSGPCFTCNNPAHAACQTLCCIVSFPIIRYRVRGLIREKTMVKGTASQDFCYSCCCNALALAQEARHLDANAYKGGEIIPLPAWRKFLKPCFPVKKRDNRLFQAAREGQTKKCEDLLIGGANVNVRDALDFSPLMTAAACGKLETCDFLIKAKADMNCTDRIGATPLMKAAQKGHFETVFLLWNSGADVTAKDSFGKSAYDYAIGETKSTLAAILRIKDNGNALV